VVAWGTGRQLGSSFRALGAVFANPGLRWMELARAAMSLAIWSYVIALGVYAFDVGGATAVGLVALVRLLPGALAAPVGGILVDRHSRRAVLVLSSLGGTAALGASAIVGAISAPAVVAFTLAGVFTIFCSPYVSAEGALAPLVARTPQELS